MQNHFASINLFNKNVNQHKFLYLSFISLSISLFTSFYIHCDRAMFWYFFYICLWMYKLSKKKNSSSLIFFFGYLLEGNKLYIFLCFLCNQVRQNKNFYAHIELRMKEIMVTTVSWEEENNRKKNYKKGIIAITYFIRVAMKNKISSLVDTIVPDFFGMESIFIDIFVVAL